MLTWETAKTIRSSITADWMLQRHNNRHLKGEKIYQHRGPHGRRIELNHLLTCDILVMLYDLKIFLFFYLYKFILWPYNVFCAQTGQGLGHFFIFFFLLSALCVFAAKKQEISRKNKIKDLHNYEVYKCTYDTSVSQDCM